MPVMGGSAVSLKASAAETIAALQKDIQNARYSIEMEFYIWEEGGSVDVIIDALFAARRRGVSVRLLVDDLALETFCARMLDETLKLLALRLLLPCR